MTTKEVANRLVELCRKGDFDAAQSELFADDAASIEPYATPDFPKETKGKNALKEKSEKFNSMVASIHGIEVSEPLVAGNSFACTLHMHVVMKEKGEMDMAELCVYKVKDGKIIEEQFYL